MNILNSNSFRLTERSLDAAALRQKVIANNIANVDTPSFKRSDVRFEELLQSEMSRSSIIGKRTDLRHIPIGAGSALAGPSIVEDSTSVMNNNGNNVDIDSEMSLMAKNQLRYNVMTQHVNHEIQNYRTVLGGRG